MASSIEQLHFPSLTVPVTIENQFTVSPADQIPAKLGDSLYLSNFDDGIGVRVLTPTIYFYEGTKHTDSVFQTLRHALSLVLVPYYPLTGRIRESDGGKLEVFFGHEQGALMVEARSDLTISSLGDLSVPNPGWAPLVFTFPDEEPFNVINIPLVIAQVTLFACGGFSLGLRLCHCICDGLGAMQFINAWASTAKSGRLVADPMPCWDREFFKPREPPRVTFPHLEFMKMEEGSNLTKSLYESKRVQTCYLISRELQLRAKNIAQSKGNKECTTFDAMAAHIWRSWVKAIEVKPDDYTLRLTFSVNVRGKMTKPPLKKGYYGNVVCVACAVSSAENLVKSDLADIAGLVTAARMGVSEEYVRSSIDYVQLRRPERLEFGGKLTITQWSRFRMYECGNFGWGGPIYAGPIDLTATPQVCVFLPEGNGDSGSRMAVFICLPEQATAKFENLLMI